MSTRMRARWLPDPDEPELSAEHPEIRGLVAEIAPGSDVTDLGGTMSLNLRLDSAGLVLRVHPAFVSKSRTLALREIRRRLLASGLVAAEPRPLPDGDVITVDGRCVELEALVPFEKPEATWESYQWMYGTMGRLHRATARLDVSMPRPVLSTYGPPGSLRRWMSVTEPAVQHDEVAADVAGLLRRLIGVLTVDWVPESKLPVGFVHGDVRLGNVGLGPRQESVYLDFGFAARRPLVHDLAYSLAWIILRPDDQGEAERFAWPELRGLVAAYESAAGRRLTPIERRALPSYLAAVPMYLSAIAGFMPDPVEHLRNEVRQRLLRSSEWILAHPDVVTGVLA